MRDIPTVAQMISQAMEDRDLTQAEAYRELGCSKMTLLHWIKEFTVPGIDRYEVIARFVERPATDVLTAILRDGHGLDVALDSVSAMPG